MKTFLSINSFLITLAIVFPNRSIAGPVKRLPTKSPSSVQSILKLAVNSCRISEQKRLFTSLKKNGLRPVRIKVGSFPLKEFVFNVELRDRKLLLMPSIKLGFKIDQKNRVVIGEESENGSLVDISEFDEMFWFAQTPNIDHRLLTDEYSSCISQILVNAGVKVRVKSIDNLNESFESDNFSTALNEN